MKFVIDLIGFVLKIIPDLMELLRKTDEDKKKRREERKREREQEEEARRVQDSIKNNRPSTIADWADDNNEV